MHIQENAHFEIGRSVAAAVTPTTILAPTATPTVVEDSNCCEPCRSRLSYESTWDQPSDLSAAIVAKRVAKAAEAVDMIDHRTKPSKLGCPIGHSTGAASEPIRSHILSRLRPDIDETRRPRTYLMFGCLVTFCCFLLMALSCGTIHAWGIQQEYLLSHEFKGSDATALNWVGTLQYFGMYLLGVPAGWLSETWSYPVTCFLARWFAKRRGLATGSAVAGVGVGGLVISPVTERLLSSVGVHTTLRITALYIIIIGGLASLFVFCPPQVDQGGQHVRYSMRGTFTLSVFKQPRFLAHCLMCLFAVTAYLIPYTLYPGYAVTHGVSAQKASAVVSIANAASTFGRLAFGLLSDYIGVLNMLSISISVATISVFLVWPLATHYGVQVLFGLMYGMFSGAYWTLVPLGAVTLFGPEMLARWSGIIYTMISFGVFLGNPIASVMLDTRGHGDNYLPSIFYAGSLWVVSTVCILTNRLLYSRQFFARV
ncbi:hypothetical protein EV182_002505 [Spiromyces aspiralis]|uniref:Uncharacterized protein n=1 Tax=Spiromyces aspiralis TaxID=68401 RepID=A0ACC1HRN6_9FUNG|nr:hypothetical protein EV182_002505 [Spiromyces aspiralis]